MLKAGRWVEWLVAGMVYAACVEPCSWHSCCTWRQWYIPTEEELMTMPVQAPYQVPSKDMSGVLAGLLETVRVDINERTAVARAWVEATENLLRVIDSESRTGKALAAVVEQKPRKLREVSAIRPRGPMSLRAAIREIADEILEPVTVHQLMEILRERGIEPKDVDSVDSTLYNLVKSKDGIPLKKIGPRLWGPVSA